MAGTHFSNLNVRMAFVVGGSAGDLTLTGITTSDKLLSVNNTDGTSTADKLVGVLYLDADA
jgi:hypothetical protein